MLAFRKSNFLQCVKPNADSLESNPTARSCNSGKIMLLASKETAKRPAHKANNLTSFCDPIIYTVWDPYHPINPIGIHGLLQGWLYFLLLFGFNIISRPRKLRLTTVGDPPC
jgi:hypothetical protein